MAWCRELTRPLPERTGQTRPQTAGVTAATRLQARRRGGGETWADMSGGLRLTYRVLNVSIPAAVAVSTTRKDTSGAADEKRRIRRAETQPEGTKETSRRNTRAQCI